MRKTIIVLIIICILLLTGCSKQLNAGIVTDKVYSPAHKTYSPMIILINEYTQIIPQWINHAEKWLVYVQNGDDKDCWNVSKKYYESVNIGDYVERNKK